MGFNETGKEDIRNVVGMCESRALLGNCRKINHDVQVGREHMKSEGIWDKGIGSHGTSNNR